MLQAEDIFQALIVSVLFYIFFIVYEVHHDVSNESTSSHPQIRSQLQSGDNLDAVVRTPHVSETDPRALKKDFLRREAAIALGGTLKLSEREIALNECLMMHKAQDLKAYHGANYWRQHYLTYKNKIKYSKVYQIIRDLPKGAVLHIHDLGILNADYLLKLTYLDNLFACFPHHEVRFKFAKHAPTDYGMNWDLVSDLRKRAPSKAEFDLFLKKYFTFAVANPDKTYPNSDVAWKAMMNYHNAVQSLVSYQPIWKQYIQDALKALRHERVMYVELRTILPKLYDLDGTEYPMTVTAEHYREIIERFAEEHSSSFLGAKLIYCPLRHVDRKTLDEKLAVARQIMNEIPRYFAGFDLFGQEDRGGSLSEFYLSLINTTDLNYFFHAGETINNGNTADENLVDAVMLGSKRIGHALTLPKHPMLIQEVIKRDIAVEVNVISNSMFTFVRDLRNHPLSVMLANGVPVVVSSDQPGVWDSDILSHDLYVIFVAIAHHQADLRLLKTLALNSIQYSALREDEKKVALRMFHRQWETYLNKFDPAKYGK